MCILTISRWIILRMRIVSDKNSTDNQNTQFMFNSVFPKTVPDTPQTTIRRMRYTCWINKATDIHSKYVIIIISFPWQQWFCKRATTLRLYVHVYFPSCFWYMSFSELKFRTYYISTSFKFFQTMPL